MALNRVGAGLIGLVLGTTLGAGAVGGGVRLSEGFGERVSGRESIPSLDLGERPSRIEGLEGSYGLNWGSDIRVFPYCDLKCELGGAEPEVFITHESSSGVREPYAIVVNAAGNFELHHLNPDLRVGPYNSE